MRSLQKLLGILVFIGLLSIFAGNSAATLLNNITIDEYGNGSINGQPIYGFMERDPLAPNLMAMYYPDIAPDALGDFVLVEPSTQTTVSDVIRFEPNGVYFMSDMEPGDFAPADTMPSITLATWVNSYLTPYGGTILVNDAGDEFASGVIYTPIHESSGWYDPGYYLGSQTTYTIISDVPEPSTLTLLGIGVSCLLAVVWRRRKQ
jgi:hypothetical protein